MVVGRTYSIGFHQLRDTLSLAFDYNGTKVVDIAIAKRVAIDIEGQHGVASGHLCEWQFFLHIA